LDQEVVDVVEAALGALDDDRPRDRALLLSTLVSQLAYSGTPLARRLELAEEARALARRTGDPLILAGVNAQMYLGVLSPASLPERLRDSEQAAAVTAELGDPIVDFFVALGRYDSLLELGDVDEASRWLERCQAMADAVRQPLLRWTAAWVSVALLMVRGELEAAEARAEESLSLGTECGQPDALAIYGAQLLIIRFHQGRLGEFQAMLAALTETNPGLPSFRDLLAVAYCELGRTDEADALFDIDASVGFTSIADDPLWATRVAINAELCHELRRADAAPALYAMLAPFAGQTASSAAANFGAVTRYLGMLATLQGRYDEAEAHFAEAAVKHEHMGAPIWLALTRLNWASMLLERRAEGDIGRAKGLLEQSLTVAERHGARSIRARAATALEAIDA
jgi:tetratricopeptide (TPR) repeat protein